MYKTDCRNAFLGYNIGQYTKKYDTMRNIDFNYIQSALYNILINRGCKTVDMIIGPVYLTETLYRIETCFWGNKRVPYTDTITVTNGVLWLHGKIVRRA